MKCLIDWDVGAVRFTQRQLTQMANYEIMVDMEHYKHELWKTEVSKECKLTPEKVVVGKRNDTFAWWPW